MQSLIYSHDHMRLPLNGKWRVLLADGTSTQMDIPGTLDENEIGHRDFISKSWHPDLENEGDTRIHEDQRISTRLTRKYTDEGKVFIEKEIKITCASDQRYFLEVERARHLRLQIDGIEIAHYAPETISTPHIFEVTGKIGNTGVHTIRFVADNSYAGMPREAIMFSSVATDESQTNWNGLLGNVCIREERMVCITGIRVYPNLRQPNGTLLIIMTIDAACDYSGVLTIDSDVLTETVHKMLQIKKGIHIIQLSAALKKNISCWDEYEGHLCELSAQLSGMDHKKTIFGIRSFASNEKGRLELNGRTVFLRAETNCAVFPETGHVPMDIPSWEKIFETYISYGVNAVRFHSYCPPEAAFAAADRLGLMLQPELSHWDSKHAFEDPVSLNYYENELEQILLTYANHPSFVMMTLGNELWAADEGHSKMTQLLKKAHEIDSTRLFANGSNVHFGKCGCDPDSDFYSAAAWYDEPLRSTDAGIPATGMGRREDRLKIKGTMNNCYPDAKKDYRSVINKIHGTYRKPVFGFEVGQYQILPYFDEIPRFQGISTPDNYTLVKEKAMALYTGEDWNRQVEATGEIALLAYREEIEAAMRTEEMSGIALLGLQDFPGQGTALVGMLDSHLEIKPFSFADPRRFRSFFSDTLLLVKLEKYTYENDEMLQAPIVFANYGKQNVYGRVVCTLTGKGVSICGELQDTNCPKGYHTDMGTVEIDLSAIRENGMYTLNVMLGDIQNNYSVWVYRKDRMICPEHVYMTKHLDAETETVLKNGGTVYLSPDSVSEQLPTSIQAQFTTDFWSGRTFPAQEGGMGQLIDHEHPLFREFPTSFHTDWQWWPMASQRAIILPKVIKSIVAEMDSIAYMRPMTQLFECRCLGGNLLVSSMGLQNLQEFPEARALQSAIFRYLASDECRPQQTFSPEWIRKIVI